jgi:hypothetical protein
MFAMKVLPLRAPSAPDKSGSGKPLHVASNENSARPTAVQFQQTGSVSDTVTVYRTAPF